MDEYMLSAIAEAKQGLLEGGIPIGSVLVKDGVIIGQGHNKRVQDGDPVTHAEIDCLRNAGRIGTYEGTTFVFNLNALLSLRWGGGSIWYQKSNRWRITDFCRCSRLYEVLRGGSYRSRFD